MDLNGLLCGCGRRGCHEVPGFRVTTDAGIQALYRGPAAKDPMAYIVGAEIYDHLDEYATYPGYSDRQRLAIEYAERFAAAGYDTRSFTANAWITDSLGMIRGFAWRCSPLT